MDSGTPSNAKALDSSSISQVRVIVRVRPFLPREICEKDGDARPCVSVLDGNPRDASEVAVHLRDPDTSRNECYQLDAFFGQEDDNVKQIYDSEVKPLIPGTFQGFNATVLAYGATGSGKTFTMQGTDELPGLMPLTMSTVLSMCEKMGAKAEISYYEVYLDRCWDLLEVKAKEIAIWDDKDGQVHLKGLSRVPVNSMSEFHEAYSCGIQRRKVAHTGLNDVSSRSHGVLVISVTSPCAIGSEGFVIGKINLIDLAGNEDNRRTCNEGIRLQESAKINQSLFVLSNVIYALNNNQSRVPYRESKLTRILQDSLGGTSKALMVACLNPGEYHESVRTVSLAARSRHISNHVSSTPKVEASKVRVDMAEKLQAWLESKGKTKSAHRMTALRSPLMGRTPSCLSSIKKTEHQKSAIAEGTTNQKQVHTGRRDAFVTARNLFNDETTASLHLPVSLQNLHLSSPNKEEKRETSTEVKPLKSAANKSDDPLENYEKSARPKKCSELSPFRKALSPMDSNAEQYPEGGEATVSDMQCPSTLEPKTPKTPSLAADTKNSQMGFTPFEKFNAWSTSVKSSLVQEYIDFLNTASREELLELKGIGQKMAEYILDLRETSPLRSLNDLEKIGLSSRQVLQLNPSIHSPSHKISHKYQSLVVGTYCHELLDPL
ncbi:PREDICTED: kinesin-like protein KIN-10B isoform X1 [Tarenaya hassleriana]|uniref:kinesin-like protein KIN-10B isoform X1 n=2 Tax=Tarenaya hassleriana TaxID=28532 RepID=UPI00053C9250|nr:PREDICTED: kinesin-like protein KIN-10B isoform X1 [Tarenaya hassleriana]